MKEAKPQATLDVSELELEGVYFNAKDNLVQIKKIDTIKKELCIFNISEQTTYYSIPFHRHNIVKKVR
jgi:hypothetical protein